MLASTENCLPFLAVLKGLAEESDVVKAEENYVYHMLSSPDAEHDYGSCLF